MHILRYVETIQDFSCSELTSCEFPLTSKFHFHYANIWYYEMVSLVEHTTGSMFSDYIEIANYAFIIDYTVLVEETDKRGTQWVNLIRVR